MKINRKIYSKVALFLLGVSPIVWNANPVRAITGTEAIDNTSFTVTPSTLGDNSASGALAIDNSEFGDIFADGDTFLLLGATSDDASIAASSDDVNSSGQSGLFSVTTDNITNGLDVTFDWAFQGNGEASDSFSVSIAGSGGLVTLLNQPTYGGGTFSQNVDVSSLTAGDYTFFISLAESNTPFSGNSAAGFDNISITEVPSAAVPFVFSPALGLFFVGGLFGGSSYLKRKQTAKIDLK
ncbi:conserved exported hypothetical protein [Hyella patelloides LEGE 07179]|uniref:Uncharacterized protein n=1 Tax=Hyella patelloides LEGE 07179 TaxID=945734 RepID=A0A563W3X1_9CYAN|nr:hypothetical protein [Hyella patelloides]VEP18382.1 conserved exported hypothetical protein [Hyella patelloides LEGE 07179]